MAKPDADRALKKLNPSDELADQIISNVEKRRFSREWSKEGGQFIPYPATFLNQRRWEDEEQQKEVGEIEKEILRELGENV